MKGYEIGQPYYEANVWILNGCGDPLLLDEFTTKREAVKCVKDFLKTYTGSEKLDCFVKHFDENGCCDGFVIEVEQR